MILPLRLAILHCILDRQVDQLEIAPRSRAARHLALDCLSLAADPRGEVPSPSVIEPGHLRQSGGLPVGEAVGEPGLKVGDSDHQACVPLVKT